MSRSKRSEALYSSPTEAILESISDGVFTVDLEWRILSFNRAAEEITGVSRSEAIGQSCSDVFRSSMCGEDCPLKSTVQGGKPRIGVSGFIVTAEGQRVPISISTAVMRGLDGSVIGGAETFRDLSELEALRRELGGHRGVGDLASHSPAMRRILGMLPALAASPSTVLILGASGTGKERIARALHAMSSRSQGPFVALNCGALPDPLLESELFGYKAGAFTGATRDKPGRFALARGGTLFLDELGELSPALQVKLLRVLQERTYEPLGGTRTEQADVRVIAATNRNLAERVAQGTFREDLYYRINVIRVELPSLRQRMEDLPLLVDQFIERFNHLQGRRVQGIRPEALSLLMAHDWPGNIRELENAIERAFILCGEAPIGIEHLPDELLAFRPWDGTNRASAHDALDRQAILRALETHRGNRSAAAAALGVHKTTLLRRVKRLGIPLPTEDGRSR
ncbi:sigma-54 interaction domain-containing protein [Holophaga foetida]|uniref:sigma-54 interaction domain-containing protein n=1 Tax=Holophaga foetida TaxID=35839 RepID=UPI0002475041|nr:sigma-54-dependent Fis family transcriptional regulator [Holophaga foetida]